MMLKAQAATPATLTTCALICGHHNNSRHRAQQDLAQSLCKCRGTMGLGEQDATPPSGSGEPPTKLPILPPLAGVVGMARRISAIPQRRASENNRMRTGSDLVWRPLERVWSVDLRHSNNLGLRRCAADEQNGERECGVGVGTLSGEHEPRFVCRVRSSHDPAGSHVLERRYSRPWSCLCACFRTAGFHCRSGMRSEHNGHSPLKTLFASPPISLYFCPLP